MSVAPTSPTVSPAPVSTSAPAAPPVVVPAPVGSPTPAAPGDSALPAPTPVPAVEPVASEDGLTQDELRKKLDVSRKELRALLEQKKKVDYELGALESSIYAFEGSYLSDTLLPASSSNSSQFGNIIRGYDSYLKAPPTGSDRKRGRGIEEARESERIFSKSSSTYQRAVETRDIITTNRPQVQEMASESDEEELERASRKKRRDR